jgi:predicted dehydrogenase
MKTTRRQFLVRAAAASAGPLLLPAAVWAAQGDATPNNRLALGFIGVGKQGRHLLHSFLPHADVQVVAVNDVDTTRRLHHKKLVEDFYATKQDKSFQGCADYQDFRDLIARKDIDAVVIATPDHWHAYPVVMAAKARKDIYCEKPLSLTIHEARAMAVATRKNKIVFQTGSMQRSSTEFWKACSLVRNGAIGKIQEIYVSVGGPSKPCDLPEETLEPGLNWDFWLGQTPTRPYNSVLSPRGVHDHFPNWRGFREYSGGGMTDWGAHHFDIAQWGLGMDASGPIEVTPPDGKEIKRLHFRYATGVRMIHGGLPDNKYRFGVVFVGERGKICVDRGRFMAEPEEVANVKIEDLPIQLYRSTNHYKDFTNAIRSRKPPVCDVETGARTVTVCHLANLAYWNKTALKWDPKSERFLKGGGENAWLTREVRGPWTV